MLTLDDVRGADTPRVMALQSLVILLLARLTPEDRQALLDQTDRDAQETQQAHGDMGDLRVRERHDQAAAIRRELIQRAGFV